MLYLVCLLRCCAKAISGIWIWSMLFVSFALFTLLQLISQKFSLHFRSIFVAFSLHFRWLLWPTSLDFAESHLDLAQLSTLYPWLVSLGVIAILAALWWFIIRFCHIIQLIFVTSSNPISQTFPVFDFSSMLSYCLYCVYCLKLSLLSATNFSSERIFHAL